MITFKWKDVGLTESVFSGNNKIGTIKKVQDGWQFFKLFARHGGEVFDKISDCEDDIIKNFLVCQ